jgi:hypothetical protein
MQMVLSTLKNYNIDIVLLIAMLNIPVLKEQPDAWFICGVNIYYT